MKKWLFLLGILILALSLFVGCEEETTEAIGTPRNLSVSVAGNDSLSIELDWDAPLEGTAAKYLVYFDNVLIDSVDAPATAMELTPTTLGDYRVSAVSDDDEESDKSSAVSTDVVAFMSQGPVYWISDPSPTHPSAFGWNDDGSGTTYSASEANQAHIDFYIDADFDIASPSRTSWSNPNTTGMKLAATGYDNLKIADVSGYGDYEDIVDGGTYLFWVQDAYYVKLQISGYDAVNHNITFKYAFQTVPGYRRLGDN
ncbi:hypothetical protein JW877_08350 [bacterium]|nr:hypothetical protein [bacterium]